MRYIVEKGSMAIDGIRLTVAKTDGTGFSCSIIPHTIGQTILPFKKIGSIVNLETDVVGKYVKKLAEKGYGSKGNSSDIEKPVTDKGLLELL